MDALRLILEDEGLPPTTAQASAQQLAGLFHEFASAPPHDCTWASRDEVLALQSAAEGARAAAYFPAFGAALLPCEGHGGRPLLRVCIVGLDEWSFRMHSLNEGARQSSAAGMGFSVTMGDAVAGSFEELVVTVQRLIAKAEKEAQQAESGKRERQ